ncbi:MAG TPA: prolipoprotein diacylglyceryl transferase [Jatrophihabitantaceae bacterium]|jgi:prolipoprotein diacylglyceryl transferase
MASIPSPTRAVWHLGPIPVRAYALCIVVGIFVALAVASRRWRARGGKSDDIWDVAGWAIVFGIIGGRLYHVITDYEKYFDKGKHPLDAFKIWDGGLGIWGAIALGVLGAWIGCYRKGIRLTAFADAAIPGVVAAQGIGRWGNWFNNELYGRPTNVPWRLEIHDIDVTTGRAQPCGFGHLGQTVCGYYHPTFLYESLWDLALAVALIWAARRWKLGRGNTFALYAMGYTVGRFWIEAMRSDYAHRFFGLRLNDWASVIVFVGALAWFLRHRGVYDESPYTRARAKTLDEDLDDEPPDEESPPDDEADNADDKADEAPDDEANEANDEANAADEDAVSAPEGSDRR